ncbi:MAG: tetratricopeptide repeat protein, partial [Azospirillaceae bacterium]
PGRPAGLEISVGTGGGAAPPGAGATLRQAGAALDAGAYDSASELYLDVLLAAPDHVEALFGLAASLQGMGQTAEARATYREVLALAPDHRGARINLAGLLADGGPGGDPGEAVALVESMLAGAPDDPALWSQLARVRFAAGRTDAALAAAERAVSLAPDRLGPRYNLAVLLDRAGRHGAAARAYSAVLRQAEAGAAEAAGLPIPALRRRLAALVALAETGGSDSGLAEAGVAGAGR